MDSPQLMQKQLHHNQSTHLDINAIDDESNIDPSLQTVLIDVTVEDEGMHVHDSFRYLG